MSAALTRSVRVALQRKAVCSGQQVSSAAAAVQVRCNSNGPRKQQQFGGRGSKKGGDDDLYDPYKLYQDEHGRPGYREFNPDMLDDMDEFEWEEPEEVMADKSWPMTSGTDLFADLINVSSEPPAPEKLEPIMAEFFRRIDHKPLDQIELPDISVAVPADHPDKDALEIMKLSLLNNGRIKMDDKNEIMESLIDELNHLRKDKTTLFKNLD